MVKIPQRWLPDARMKRVICHWTAGIHKASNLDKQHYHILIERDGALVRGRHSIAANEKLVRGRYAAHTLNRNTGSIGVTVCCMVGASERPFDAGRFPMKELQWQTMAEVVAQLCKRYGIKVGAKTVLGHGEVQRNLGIWQRGKWDPMVLPWAPEMRSREVGDAFRDLVSSIRAGGQDRQPAILDVVLNDAPLTDSMSSNEESYIKLSSLLAALGAEIVGADKDFVVIKPAGSGRPISLRHATFPDQEFDDDDPEAEIVRIISETGFVEVLAFAEALRLAVAVDDTSGRVDLKQPAPSAGPAEASTKSIAIRRGDTLYAIAARYLGDGNRWTEITRSVGSTFTEREARRIQPGDVVLVPASGPTPGAPSPQPSTGAEPADPLSSFTALFPQGDAEDGLADILIDAVASEIRSYAKESIPIILAECQANGITNSAQIAYILATSDHESKAGKFPHEIWGPTARQRRYEKRRDLGNNQSGDGFRFRGRGYVQITGRSNYRFWKNKLGLDLLGDPDIVARNPAVAAKILVIGMRDGTFRPPHKLARYIKDGQNDFFNAREIINADKAIIARGHSAPNGTRIAALAEDYLSAFS